MTCPKGLRLCVGYRGWPIVSGVEQLRCLIVDDSAHFVAAATELLEGQGITVVGAASNIAEALQRVQELRPDVTLVDVHLGEDSGFDLAERLRGEDSAVILTSTYAEHDFPEQVSASQAIGFLPKLALSSNAIRNMLAARPRANEPPGN
jgi:DNA-binding NarL/FixJ family response regulator